jgi:hypothetical protein
VVSCSFRCNRGEQEEKGWPCVRVASIPGGARWRGADINALAGRSRSVASLLLGSAWSVLGRSVATAEASTVILSCGSLDGLDSFGTPD